MAALVSYMSVWLGRPPNLSRPVRALFDIVSRQGQAAYLTRYFELRPAQRTPLAAWQPVIDAARMNEQIGGEQERLLQRTKQGLTT